MALKDKGRCGCGLYGAIVRLSPRIVDGGMTRDSVYRITDDQSPQEHNVRYLWDDDEYRCIPICLKGVEFIA